MYKEGKFLVIIRKSVEREKGCNVKGQRGEVGKEFPGSYAQQTMAGLMRFLRNRIEREVSKWIGFSDYQDLSGLASATLLP